MFDTWTAAQKQAAIKWWLWWAFQQTTPSGYTAFQWWFDLYSLMDSPPSSEESKFAAGYPNEWFVRQFWKAQSDEQAFWNAVLTQLVLVA
jgi:hypothetical protein